LSRCDQICGDAAGGRGQHLGRGTADRGQGAITVVDTGPGADAAYTVRAEQSTGVGLANIRDRLAQAYGADHRFETQTNIQGGFSVTVEIPYSADAPEESK
jgi:signal transduction histidine kinase